MRKIITRKILGILFAAGLFGIPALATAGEEVFAVDSSTDSLYKIDLGTGFTTLIGPLHPDLMRFTTPVSMAVHPFSGVIFVNNNSPVER